MLEENSFIRAKILCFSYKNYVPYLKWDDERIFKSITVTRYIPTQGLIKKFSFLLEYAGCFYPYPYLDQFNFIIVASDQRIFQKKTLRCIHKQRISSLGINPFVSVHDTRNLKILNIDLCFIEKIT